MVELDGIVAFILFIALFILSIANFKLFFSDVIVSRAKVLSSVVLDNISASCIFTKHSLITL